MVNFLYQIAKPVGKDKILFSEEIELLTRLAGNETQLKVNSKEISAHFDLGTKSVGKHWFNPYLSFKTPRITSEGGWLQSVTFGSVFHVNPQSLQFWARHHSDLTLTPSLDGHKNADRPEIQIRQNFTIGWKQYLFGITENWSFRRGFNRSAKLSAAVVDPKYNAFLELDVRDPLDFVSITTGGWYQVHKNTKLYGQVSENLTQKKWNFTAGIDHSLSTGLGIKVGYLHQEKLASVLSFKFNKYFSGSLLLDVRYSNDRSC